MEEVLVDTSNLKIGFEDGHDFFRWLYYTKHITYTEYMQSEESMRKILYQDYMLEQNNDIDYDSIDPNEAYIILQKLYDDMLTTCGVPDKLVNTIGVSINALKFCINNNIIVN